MYNAKQGQENEYLQHRAVASPSKFGNISSPLYFFVGFGGCFFFRGNFSGLQFPDPDPLVEMARISLQQRWSEPLWFGPLWIDAILAALAEATDAVGGVTRDGGMDGGGGQEGNRKIPPFCVETWGM